MITPSIIATLEHAEELHGHAGHTSVPVPRAVLKQLLAIAKRDHPNQDILAESQKFQRRKTRS